MAAIAVVGSVNADLILRLDHIPRPGETVLGREFTIAGGGKGANQAIAAHRSGVCVSLIACVGDDIYGHEAIARLAADNIDTRHVVRSADSPTGVALIFVDDGGENSIGVGPGANAALRADDVENARDAIASADALLVQLETSLEPIETAIAIAHNHNVPVILNPAPACPLPPQLLRKVSILTPNRLEAEALTGVRVADSAGARSAAMHLHEIGVEIVIVTMGADGVLVSGPDGVVHLAAYAVRAIDSTAAGDTFSGALVAALAEKKPLIEAARFANAAAAISVARPGTQTSMPHRAEIDAFLEMETARAQNPAAEARRAGI